MQTLNFCIILVQLFVVQCQDVFAAESVYLPEWLRKAISLLLFSSVQGGLIEKWNGASVQKRCFASVLMR